VGSGGSFGWQGDQSEIAVSGQMGRFRIEHNSWEPWDSVHAPKLIAEFYWKHPGAACQIRAIDFSAIPFHIVLSCHSLKGG
jgi:hypothetical protein